MGFYYTQWKRLDIYFLCWSHCYMRWISLRWMYKSSGLFCILRNVYWSLPTILLISYEPTATSKPFIREDEYFSGHGIGVLLPKSISYCIITKIVDIGLAFSIRWKRLPERNQKVKMERLFLNWGKSALSDFGKATQCEFGNQVAFSNLLCYITAGDIILNIQHSCVPLDFAGHNRWRHLSVELSRNHWQPGKLERKMSNFLVSIVPSDGLITLGDETSASCCDYVNLNLYRSCCKHVEYIKSNLYVSVSP